MQLDSFGYSVSAQVTLTGAELAHLFEVGSSHYDGRCKAWSKKRLHQDMAVLVFSHDLADHLPENTPEACAALCKENGHLTIEVTFTSTELDTMNKIMEMDGYGPNPMPELSWQLSQTFRKVNQRVQELYEADENGTA